MELSKLIMRVTKKNWNVENHRPEWIQETHRVHFHLKSGATVPARLRIIDEEEPNRAVIDRAVTVNPRPTKAQHPSTPGVINPIGVVTVAEEAETAIALAAADGAKATTSPTVAEAAGASSGAAPAAVAAAPAAAAAAAAAAAVINGNA